MERSLWHRMAQLLQIGMFLSIPTLVKPYWTTFVQSLGGPKWANVIGVCVLHVLTLAVANLQFYIFYKFEIPYIEAWKTHKGAWPWKRSAKEAAEFTSLVWMGVGLTFFNVLLTLPASVANYDLSVRLGYSASLYDYPSTAKVVLYLIAFSVLEDTLFYWCHRTLHHPQLYPWIHKLHHRFTHSVSISAEATHPVEFLLGNVIPFAAGPLLCGAHLLTLYMWTVWRIGETVFNHSGYDLPWSVYELMPFQGTAEAHDAHHSTPVGNYGSLYKWWDQLCGTEIAEVVAGAGLREHKAFLHHTEKRNK